MRNWESSNQISAMKSRAKFFVLVLLSLLLPSVGRCTEQRVRAGYSAMSGSMAWVWAAKEAGYFDKHGLKVDLVYIGGTAQLFQSMLAGEIAFGIGGGPSIIHANMQRRSIVGVAGTLNRMIMKIMASPQIKTSADLRGKRIAVTRFGTSTDFAARLFLKIRICPPRKTPQYCKWGACRMSWRLSRTVLVKREHCRRRPICRPNKWAFLS